MIRGVLLGIRAGRPDDGEVVSVLKESRATYFYHGRRYLDGSQARISCKYHFFNPFNAITKDHRMQIIASHKRAVFNSSQIAPAIHNP